MRRATAFVSLALLAVGAVLLLTSVAEVYAVKENLPSNAKLIVDEVSLPTECARKTRSGDKLAMHYTGTLYTDDSKFDSSRDRNSPFRFTLGKGQVIKGWDQGLTEMCIGEKRKLTIPSDLGYGSRGAGGKIPGGATLVFDVELLDIESKEL